MFNEKQIWFSFSQNEMKSDKVIIKDIIIDRKSKYTTVAFKVKSKEEIQEKVKELILDDYFRKATHNSYAFRIRQENNSIIEWKNDDWETWAWMCILRELQREESVNILLIVTRYFWWIKLQTDRFKNVIDACKMFFEKKNRWEF